MTYKETKIHVKCAITRRPEVVYICTFDNQDIHEDVFNGCDSNCHHCRECYVICKDTAIAKYRQILSEGPPPLRHTP